MKQKWRSLLAVGLLGIGGFGFIFLLAGDWLIKASLNHATPELLGSTLLVSVMFAGAAIVALWVLHLFSKLGARLSGVSVAAALRRVEAGSHDLSRLRRDRPAHRHETSAGRRKCGIHALHPDPPNQAVLF